MTRTEVSIIFAIIGVLGFFAWRGFSQKPLSGTVARAHSSMRTLSTVLESYRNEHGAYPPAILTSETSVTPRQIRAANAAGVTTIDLRFPLPNGMIGNYLQAAMTDNHSPRESLPFAYHTSGDGWILAATGPNGRYDFNDLAELYARYTSGAGGALDALRYDPTNGLRSAGDLFRVSLRRSEGSEDP